METSPERAPLQGLGTEIFALVASSATPEQWKEWLRVPLEHAAARGSLGLFIKLLGAGANGAAGWRGCFGRTLLDAAATGGNEDIVSCLLGAGAQPDVDVVSSSPGRSALYTATAGGHEAAAIRLVVAGADVNFEDPVEKRSVLHAAVDGGHDQLVNNLVVGGADPNARTEDGKTSLHLAAGLGFSGIVSTLLLRGADKDAVDDMGNTPLMHASIYERPCVAKTLVAAGADIDIRNKLALSPLQVAACAARVPVIQAILSCGADVDSRDHRGFSILYAAAISPRPGVVVDALVEAGADIELKSNGGSTPLLFAATHASCEGMLALLRHGANITARGIVGDTALHLACSGKYQGLEACVELLLRWGADETALNSRKQTPTDVLGEEAGIVHERASHDEIKRARLLLSRAPADRAWRRRGWLAMLRARAEKARAAVSCDSRDEVADCPGAANGPRVDRGGKVARREETGCGGGDHAVRRQASNGVGLDRADGDGDGDGGVLSGSVALLVGLEPEGVFRTVLSFL